MRLYRRPGMRIALPQGSQHRLTRLKQVQAICLSQVVLIFVAVIIYDWPVSVDLHMVRSSSIKPINLVAVGDLLSNCVGGPSQSSAFKVEQVAYIQAVTRF